MYWTDSLINLCRVKGILNEYKPFVEKRLSKIRSGSGIDEWHYVPTDHNPADLPSRGCTLRELLSVPWWTAGPAFARESILKESQFDHDLVNKYDPGSNPVGTDLRGDTVCIILGPTNTAPIETMKDTPGRVAGVW